MYVVFMPYWVLNRANVDISMSENKRQCPPLLGEGTGTVWPLQTEDCFPNIYSRQGKEFSDSVVRGNKLQGVRRTIWNPAKSTDKDKRVAEFYLRVVCGTSPFENVGMYAFLDKDKKIGAHLDDILRGNLENFSMLYVPGTSQDEPGCKEETKGAQKLLRLHEPAIKGHLLEHTRVPTGNIMSRLGALGNTTGKSKTRFLFTSQDVGHDIEEKFIGALEKRSDEITGVKIKTHDIAGVGSLMVDVYLK
jgi:hypothetical protein